jgi:flagellar basal body-associated protein FliL
MENIATIIYIIIVFCSFLITAVPAVIAFVKAAKAKKQAKEHAENATTEAERAKAEAAYSAAELEMEQAAKSFIAEAEITYKSFDDLLKAKGQSAGAIKKETVLAKLRNYAIEKGITIDSEKWSERIDELVAFTKKVNSK